MIQWKNKRSLLIRTKHMYLCMKEFLLFFILCVCTTNENYSNFINFFFLSISDLFLFVHICTMMMKKNSMKIIFNQILKKNYLRNIFKAFCVQQPLTQHTFRNAVLCVSVCIYRQEYFLLLLLIFCSSSVCVCVFQYIRTHFQICS